MNNLELWDKVKCPPKEALKQIIGGRLKGKTDINPQWRYKVLTEQFGICGIGWKYETVNKWREDGADGVVMCFADVNLYIKHNGEWSEPIQGTGGSQLIEKEKSGLYTNDEGYKMAITDALSVCCKMIGIASDVYEGKDCFNTKYDKKQNNTEEKQWFNDIDLENDKVLLGLQKLKSQGLTNDQILKQILKKYKVSKVMQDKILKLDI